MKRKIIKKRKIKSQLQFLTNGLGIFFDIPLVKTIFFMMIALCILLIIAPFILTKFTPDTAPPKKEIIPQTKFEKVEIPRKITIYRSETGKNETIPFEDYIKGVVSSEMPSSFHLEALKAQAVAARTYSLARVLKAEANGNPEAHKSAALCDTTHCQVYQNTSELKEIKGKEWMKNDWKKICKATDETAGKLLYYKGELVEQALFHSSSGGKTENSEDVFASAVPYLVSVDSPYEDEATHQEEQHSFSIQELSDSVKSKYPDISFGTINTSNIKVLNRSSGNRVEKIQLGNGILEGRELREALNLPSSNFTIEISNETVTFTTNGSGHGVGMSQYGANGMAKNGYNYKEILTHYYSGTEIH